MKVFRIVFRNIWKHKLFFSINISGLVLGITSFLLLGLYVFDEMSFDQMHGDNIYRLTSELPGRKIAMTPYRWWQSLVEEIPEIIDATSVQPLSLTVRDQSRVFRETQIFAADSTFQQIFNFRILTGETTILKEPNVMAITPSVATKYFGRENPIGKNLDINIFGTFVQFKVGSVIECPPNSHLQFDFLIPYELIKRNSFNPGAYTSWSTHFIYTYVELAEGVSNSILKKKLKDFLLTNGGQRIHDRFTPDIQKLDQVYLRSSHEFDIQPKGSATNVRILTVSAIALLLIALVNFVNLSTAQNLKRAKEVAVKKVMGSNKIMIVSQFLFESVIACFIAVLISICLVALLLPLLNDFADKSIAPEIIWNLKFMFGSIAFSSLVGILAGLYPALMVSRYKAITVLRSRSAARSKGSSARKGLVILQFGLALILLISTGVIYKQVSYMIGKDLGFNQNQVIVISDAGEISSDTDKTSLLRAQLKEINGVSEVAASSSYPGFNTWGINFRPDGFESENDGLSLSTIFADYSFLKTYDIPIIIGRDYDHQLMSDSNAFLINRAALDLFASEDSTWRTNPLNKNLAAPFLSKKGPVIGVFENFHFESLEKDISPLIITIYPNYYFNIQIKVNSQDFAASIETISTKWKNLFPDTPFDFRFMNQEFAQHFESNRQLNKILEMFAIISILVAILGLFGLSSLLAIEKSREVCIRKVVGASERQLYALLSWNFLRLILIASLLGLPTSYYLMKLWLNTFAYKISMPISAFIWSLLLVLLTALITISYHALTTARSNPVDKLSVE